MVEDDSGMVDWLQASRPPFFGNWSSEFQYMFDPQNKNAEIQRRETHRLYDRMELWIQTQEYNWQQEINDRYEDDRQSRALHGIGFDGSTHYPPPQINHSRRVDPHADAARDVGAGSSSDAFNFSELGQHAIEYKPRPTIKGQVLADFIAEIPQEKEEECKREIEIPVDQQKDDVWKLFTDGASNDEGAGAGLRITNPQGQHFTYAIRLKFKSTNSEAEYEALLAGLRITKKLGARHLEAHVDSMLVVNQIEGSYDAKDDKMASYLAQAKVLMAAFTPRKVKHINRSENKQTDALSKLASVGFEHLAKDVRIEVLTTPSIMNKEVFVCSEAEESWMTPIINYLARGILPQIKAEARKIRHKALNYTIQGDILYRRSYLGPILRCVDPQDASYLLREIHEGICGVHAGPRMVVSKIMNTRYYWPGMHVDAEKELRRCSACQRHAPNTLRPKNAMIPVTASWPFQKWAIDITLPFPEAPGRVKFLIVAIDYFTKWVEAKRVASINAASVKKIIWEFIICLFGLPMNLVSDNGTQFADQHIQRWLKEFSVTQTFTSVAHPQGNGEVERANRTIVGGIKKRLANHKPAWVDQLPHVLWDIRTHKNTSNAETPFSLTSGTEAMIPAEVGVPSPRITLPNDNDAKSRLDLMLLEERRELAAIREQNYKRQLQKYYNTKVKICEFNAGDCVLRNNEASRAHA
ncbi:uncharacterized protein LOC143616513 [Bidens hawaiensis]|uniref:uncharacterized protein LOC143616513 n=1 Tax=Bidens hawaiensis TaxID=980011 RepID=UPI004049B42E